MLRIQRNAVQEMKRTIAMVILLEVTWTQLCLSQNASDDKYAQIIQLIVCVHLFLIVQIAHRIPNTHTIWELSITVSKVSYSN